ncbi:MAG: electron transport complex subunit E [Ruminococcus sp.]|nr:electron transport complex subunit E [Ruminococcus sp.]
MNKRKLSVFDGLWRDNTILSSLMVISPVIVCGNTLRNAAAIIYAFSAITLFSVMIASFVPKKLPYAVKITVNAIIASLVYIPVKRAAQEFFPDIIPRIGIYFPLLAVNSIIILHTEAKFFKMKRLNMLGSLVFYILGFDLIMAVISIIREIFGHGTLNERVVDVNMTISGLGEPFGGFVFLGLLCGLYRYLRKKLSEGT